MGKFGRVPLEMHFKIAFGGEPTAANVTLKGALTCMRPDMDLEGGVTAEDLAAVSAAMLEERLVSTPGLGIVRGQGFAVLSKG